jgi:hypothetical protein
MTKITKKLEQLISKAVEQSPLIPVKTSQGILVGNVLIVSQGSLKNLWQYNQLVYKDIYLNAAAIKIANNLAKRGRIPGNNEIYTADQDYGRWFVDSQVLYKIYQSSKNAGNHDRADILWAKYCESRDRSEHAKQKVNRLSCI